MVGRYTVADPGAGNNYEPVMAWASGTALELIPQSDFDIATEDSSNTDNCGTPANIWTLVDSGDMCKEKWNIGKMGASCVKTEAYMIRTMVSANKDCDLDLDYV